MADHQSRSALPSDLDVRDPQFLQKIASSNFQTQCEILEIIAGTEKAIAESRELLAKADIILVRR